MNQQQLELYQRIQVFDFDKADTKITFIKRLQRQNRWTTDYAEKVVVEYRKFLLLAMIAGHKVIPSDQVDQAWHLHLTDSRSYWDELCPKVLGKNLHHDANPGGRTEQIYHYKNYNETLASYEHIFGQKPLVDIWPALEIRFGRDLQFVRVNSQQYWLIPKLRNNLKWVVWLCVLPILLTGCDGIMSIDKDNFGLFSVGVLLYTIFSLWVSGNIENICESNRVHECIKLQNNLQNIDLITEEIAYLTGGPRRVIESSLINLALKEKIILTGKHCRKHSFKTMHKMLNDISMFERVVVNWLDRQSGTYPLSPRQENSVTNMVRQSLLEKGLLTRSYVPAAIKTGLVLVVVVQIVLSLYCINNLFIFQIFDGFSGFVSSLVLTTFPIITFLSFILLAPLADFGKTLFIANTTGRILISSQITITETNIMKLQKLAQPLTNDDLPKVVAVFGASAVQRYPEILDSAQLELLQKMQPPIKTTNRRSSSGANSNGDYEHGSYTGGTSSCNDGTSSDCSDGGGCGGCGGD